MLVSGSVKPLIFCFKRGPRGRVTRKPKLGPTSRRDLFPGDLRGRFSKCGEIHTTLQRGRFWFLTERLDGWI